MLANWGLIGLFLLVAIFVGSTFVTLPVLLRKLGATPYKPNEVKNAPYECGLETIGDSWIRFNFRFYYYAIFFVALDVLSIFLIPFAVGLRTFENPGFVLGAVIIFVLVPVAGYIYAWRKHLLEWQ